MKIPDDLRLYFKGKTEIKRSLQTGYLADAKYKARLIAGQVQRLFRYLRLKGKVKAFRDGLRSGEFSPSGEPLSATRINNYQKQGDKELVIERIESIVKPSPIKMKLPLYLV